MLSILTGFVDFYEHDENYFSLFYTLSFENKVFETMIKNVSGH